MSRYRWPITLVDTSQGVSISLSNTNNTYYAVVSKDKILRNIDYKYVETFPENETSDRLDKAVIALTQPVRDFLDKKLPWNDLEKLGEQQ